MSGVEVIFGGGMICTGGAFASKDDLDKLFAVLKKHNINAIDTAQLYGDSEEVLGSVNAGSQFIIDTKWKGGAVPGSSTKENIIQTAEESMQKLKTDKGYFARFGLSNYHATDVEAVYNHCKEHNYVLPTVYQGNYSAVARKQETGLFPTLRKLGIAFYAYSPLAGGFLVKTKEEITAGAGRLGDMLGGLYRDMYAKPKYLEALAEWEAIAKDVGCSRADLAYRWMVYNSPLKREYGDGMIAGASKLEQMEETMEGLKAGPLPDKAVERIEQVWRTIEHEAPLDNFHR